MTVSRFLMLAVLLASSSVIAQGYMGWSFGMSKTEVAAVGTPSRYYSFSNGDIGAQDEPFEGNGVPISFYFGSDKLNRIMLIPYMGTDIARARGAWRAAYVHLKRKCSGIEVSGAGSGLVELEVALSSFEVEAGKLQRGQRHQMGCVPMPTNLRLWASITRLANDSLMVAVNYGEP
ncbi:MAG: hypothetical protein H7Y28_14385 [Rhodoferax sp.]|nr:hypothetical protein [Rhodoferax sp.]